MRRVGLADQVERALGAGLVEGVLAEVPSRSQPPPSFDGLPGLLGAHGGGDERLVGLDAAAGQPLPGLGRVHDSAVAQLTLEVARAGLLRLGVPHHHQGPHAESVARRPAPV